MIIGSQKAGTSWLAKQLQQHPDVFMPKREIHYFDKSYNFQKGLSWYEEQFEEAKNQKAIGEKTPDYLWANGQGSEGHLPNVHQNIHSILPDAKLIIVLRNPVKRAISAVHHIIRSGRISPLNFDNIDELLIGKKHYLLEGHGVIDYGRYYRQIEAYQEYFTPSQILILIFEEDIVKNPVIGLKKTCEFLNIDKNFKFQELDRKVNTSDVPIIALMLSYYIPLAKHFILRLKRYLPKTKYPYPSQSTIRKLYEIYSEDNEKLFNFLGRRIEDWELL